MSETGCASTKSATPGSLKMEKRSEIWSHFVEVEGKAQCNHCE